MNNDRMLPFLYKELLQNQKMRFILQNDRGKSDPVFHRNISLREYSHVWSSLSKCGKNTCGYFERWEVFLVPGISPPRKKATSQRPPQLL